MPRRSVAVPASALKLLLSLGLVLPAAMVMQAQISIDSGTVPRGHAGLPNGERDDDPFRSNPQLRERLEKGRAADRQRRIVDDANRLVALTAQYRTALETHGAPTEDDQKLLAQIEKLARDVKDRMRGM